MPWQKLRQVLVILPFLAALRLSGQAPHADCFPLWQGFSQRWGYNHRIHRIGDWVEQAGDKGECRARLVHAAASGSGADRADFTQYYAWLRSALVQAHPGTTTFHLSGKEGAWIAQVEIGEARFPDLHGPHAHFEVVMNGFDLCTAPGAKADKVQSLDMAIDSVWLDSTSGTVRFRIQAALRFSCSTAECEPLHQVVDYRLTLHWLALGGYGFHSQRGSYGSGREWERTDTAPPPPLTKVALLGHAHYPHAIATITGLHVQLDHEQHMLGWDSYLQPLETTHGLSMLPLRMDFQQNHPSMYAAFQERFAGKPRPPAHWVVKRKPGSLLWEMDIALLQLEDAEVSHHTRTGSIHWETRHGKQATAEGPAAESSKQVED